MQHIHQEIEKFITVMLKCGSAHLSLKSDENGELKSTVVSPEEIYQEPPSSCSKNGKSTFTSSELREVVRKMKEAEMRYYSKHWYPFKPIKRRDSMLKNILQKWLGIKDLKDLIIQETRDQRQINFNLTDGMITFEKRLQEVENAISKKVDRPSNSGSRNPKVVKRTRKKSTKRTK